MISTGLPSQVRIQSVSSQAYLCFSKKGKLIVKVRRACLNTLNDYCLIGWGDAAHRLY